MSLRRDGGFGPGAWGPLSHRRRTSFVGEGFLLFRYLAYVSARPLSLPLSSIECTHARATVLSRTSTSPPVLGISVTLLSFTCLLLWVLNCTLALLRQIFTRHPPIIFDLVFCLYAEAVSQSLKKGVSFISIFQYLRPYLLFPISTRYTLSCTPFVNEPIRPIRCTTARARLVSPNQSSAHVKPNPY